MLKLTPHSLLIVPMVYLAPDPASACQCITKAGISRSVPADGATDVPTDVKIWADASEVVLVDAQGETVPTQPLSADFTLFGGGAASCVSLKELVPAEPLRPMSQYSLVALDAPLPEHAASITFTTGAGPIEGAPPAAPNPEVVFFDATHHVNSCHPATFQLCARGDADELFEVRAQYPNSTTRFVAPLSYWSSLELQGNEGCLEIYARDTSGRLSEPATHCFDPTSFPVLPASKSAGSVPSVSCTSEDVIALFDDAADEQSDRDDDDHTDGDDEQAPSNADPLNGIDESNADNGSFTCTVKALGRNAPFGMSPIIGLIFFCVYRRRQSTRPRGSISSRRPRSRSPFFLPAHPASGTVVTTCSGK